MRIANYTIVNKEKEHVALYAEQFNSTVAVSFEVLELMEQLKAKYEDELIDEGSEAYLELLQKQGVEKLFRYNFLYKDDAETMKDKLVKYEAKLKRVYLHVTQECNLRCTYCYAHHNLGKNMMMSIDSAQKYIKDLYSNGVKQYVLTGGEPFLNSDLGKIIKYIKSYSDTYVEVLSNGTLLTGNERLLDDIDGIIISLDVESSANRRGSNRERIVESINNLSMEQRNKIALRTVVSKGEEEEIKNMKRLAAELGVKHISVPRLPNCKNDLVFLPDIDAMDNEEEWEKTMSAFRCGAATSELAIDWNGDVYPCQNLMKEEHLLTNLNEENWLETVRKAELTHMIHKANVHEISKCKDCDMKYMCGGGCRALSYNVYGVYDHCLDFFCDYYYSKSRMKLRKITYHV